MLGEDASKGFDFNFSVVKPDGRDVGIGSDGFKQFDLDLPIPKVGDLPVERVEQQRRRCRQPEKAVSDSNSHCQPILTILTTPFDNLGSIKPFGPSGPFTPSTSKCSPKIRTSEIPVFQSAVSWKLGSP